MYDLMWYKSALQNCKSETEVWTMQCLDIDKMTLIRLKHKTTSRLGTNVLDYQPDKWLRRHLSC